MQTRRLVVVGASFAGLACARAAAARGVSTTVVDTRAEAGSGVRTTGILVKEAADLLDVPSRLVRKLAKVRLYAPSMASIDLERPGYSFLATDTPGLLRWWSREATGHGVEIRWGATFRGAERGRDGHLDLTGLGLRCSFLVGADGARSRVARELGLDLNTRFLAGVEAECHGIGKLAEDRLHVFLDPKLAPGYIGWAVPGVGVTQIGLASRLPARPDLDAFITSVARVFDTRHIEVSGHRAGLIPVGGPLPGTKLRDVLLIGDAAGWVSPLTAGGIHCALQYGRSAGIAIAEHLMDGGPHPDAVLRRVLPSFAVKQWLRRLHDLGAPSRFSEAVVSRPALAALARLVFFHRRGLLSRTAWADWRTFTRRPGRA